MAVEGTRSRRRSIRLRGYDYGQEGAYFVTICTHRRTCLLGDVTDGNMTLTAVGTIVRRVWRYLPRRFRGVGLDAFIAMPNHIHGLIIIRRSVGAGLAPPEGGGLPGQTGAASRAPTLPDVVRAFKSISTVRVNRALGRTGVSLWQRGYYEHVVRDEDELTRLRRYITENPLKWDDDADNPVARRKPRRP